MREENGKLAVTVTEGCCRVDGRSPTLGSRHGSAAVHCGEVIGRSMNRDCRRRRRPRPSAITRSELSSLAVAAKGRGGRKGERSDAIPSALSLLYLYS